MKKIIFIALFSIGFFTMSHAQTLTCKLTNSSMSTWTFTMYDAGSGDATYESEILPGESRTIVISGFGFPMEFKVENSDGCGAAQFVPRPVPMTHEIIDCEKHAEIKYIIEEVTPLMGWRMDLHFG